MSHTYVRIAIYFTTIILYTGVGKFMSTHRPFNDPNPMLANYATGQLRFFTVWNYINLMLYAAIALISELFLISKKAVPKLLIKARDTYFSAIVFPGTLVVMILFWSIFTYDRNLIMPAVMDEVLPPVLNHILHTAIGPIVLSELFLQPKKATNSHKFNLTINIGYSVLYCFVTLYTYFEKGIWLYPILGVAYGTIAFPLLVLGFILLGVLFYFVENTLVSFIWGGGAEKTRKPSKKIKRKD